MAAGVLEEPAAALTNWVLRTSRTATAVPVEQLVHPALRATPEAPGMTPPEVEMAVTAGGTTPGMAGTGRVLSLAPEGPAAAEEAAQKVSLEHRRVCKSPLAVLMSPPTAAPLVTAAEGAVAALTRQAKMEATP